MKSIFFSVLFILCSAGILLAQQETTNFYCGYLGNEQQVEVLVTNLIDEMEASSGN